MSAPWTPAEDTILRTAIAERWPITRKLARLPGRRSNAIRLRAERIGAVEEAA